MIAPLKTPEELFRHFQTVESLKQLTVRHYLTRQMRKEEFKYLFLLLDAFWMYPGEPRPEQPHELLKSGEHSNGFIDCLRVLKYTNLCQIFGELMARELRSFFIKYIDWCFGPAYAAIYFTHEVACCFNAISAIVEKDEDGNPKIWSRHIIPDSASVLITNELMTTSSGSTYETKTAVSQQNKVQPVNF